MDYPNEPKKCPQCGGRTISTYGLAGGGIGLYWYCPKCEKIVDKWQDRDVDRPKGQPL